MKRKNKTIEAFNEDFMMELEKRIKETTKDYDKATDGMEKLMYRIIRTTLKNVLVSYKIAMRG